jgi:hypothetical protein
MKRAGAAILFVILAAAGWRAAQACAPDFFRAVFSYVRHPDLPRTGFINGRLGVLQPTFARSYLVIAYRYLNGIGMNAREREQASDFYADRDTGNWDNLGTSWAWRWRDVRAQIKTPSPPKVSLVTEGLMRYDPLTHSFALNCAEDGFRVAVRTLQARRSQYGATSPAFRSWLGAQDLVFRNCDEQQPQIPEAALPGMSAQLRQDREYQIAAAHFYAGDLDAALQGFRRIAQDASSPWSAISHYLVVRTLLRLTEDPARAAQAGAQLSTEAQAILANPKLAAVHGMTWNLVQRSGIRERDQVYFRDLARLLSSKGQDDGLREELWNYTGMYDHVIGSADPNITYHYEKPAPPDTARFRDADLTDWIFSFQSRDPQAFGHCLRRWQQTHSTAWLLAALTHANAPRIAGTGLLEAAAAIPQDSPGYLTARFHLLRLYEETNERAAARDGADEILSSALVRGMPSSVNLYRTLRMLAASSFEDFMRFAPRKPVMVTVQQNIGEVPRFYNDDERTPKPGELLDADATRLLNRHTPFRLLKEAALGGSLPPDLQREALMTAFTRGLMLGEDLSEIARQLGETAYLSEQSEDGKRFAGAFFLLHHPEARPYFATGITRQSRPGRLDPYRDNWWCPMDIGIALDSTANYSWFSYDKPTNRLQASTAPVIPEPFAGDNGAEAAQELEKLGRLSAATDFLGAVVLSFAKTHPADRRIPEALYWLVRAGHYGCADANTWKTTRESFRVLQLQYGKTDWAKRTPTWFKNTFDIRREVEDLKSQN